MRSLLRRWDEPAGLTVIVLTVLIVAGAIGYADTPLARPLTTPVISELYLPPATLGPVPGAVVLHGSEGYDAGFAKRFASALAGQGIAALALCYFGCPSRPATLHDIDIGQVFAAIAYLDHYPGVKTGDVSLIGFSRGDELALLAGSQDPEPRAVVAY